MGFLFVVCHIYKKNRFRQMNKNRVYHKKKTVIVFFSCLFLLTGLIVRMVYLMVIESDYYAKKAQTLHERERDIKAERGKIIDAKGEVLADNKAVCTISVIHSQIKEPEKVIEMLKKELGLSEETARKRVEKRSSIERIKTNVEKETGDRIRRTLNDIIHIRNLLQKYLDLQAQIIRELLDLKYSMMTF